MPIRFWTLVFFGKLYSGDSATGISSRIKAESSVLIIIVFIECCGGACFINVRWEPSFAAAKPLISTCFARALEDICRSSFKISLQLDSLRIPAKKGTLSFAVKM